MSGEEKAAQVGEAVLEYQSAKVAVAQLERKIATLADAYTNCANSLKRRMPADEIKREGERLKFLHTDPAENGSRLLNDVGLLALLEDQEKAENRRQVASEAMRALGITSVD
jgi:hypothetical protein